MKRIVLFVLVLTLALTSANLASSAAESKEELYDKVAQLEKAVKTLEGMVKDLSFQVQKSDGLAEIIKEVSFQMKRVESEVRGLQALEKHVTEKVMPRISGIETTVAGLATTFRDRYEALAGRVFQLEGTLDQLDARLKSVEERTRKLQELNERVAALEQAIRTPMPGGEGVAQQVDQIKVRLSKAESMMASVNDALRYKADEERVQRAEEQIKRLRDQVATVQSIAIFGVLGGIAGVVIGLGLFR